MSMERTEVLRSKLYRCLKAAINDEKLDCQVGHIVLELAEVMKNPDYNSPTMDVWCNYFLSKNETGGEKGIDDQKVTILVRDINGKRTTFAYDTWAACHSQVGVDIDDEYDEILAVYLGDAVLYSKLASEVPISVDDLTGFFA